MFFVSDAKEIRIRITAKDFLLKKRPYDQLDITLIPKAVK
jgi:hypothetical protein